MSVVAVVYWMCAGASVDMLIADRPEPRRPIGSRDCSLVQDQQSQVRDHCSILDPEVCHGLEMQDDDPSAEF